MIIYWSMFAIPAFASLAENISFRRRNFHPVLFFLVPVLFIMAFRQTGGDYYAYNLMMLRFGGLPLGEWVKITEPAYGFLNWASHSLGWGLYGVNSACAIIFLYCLYRFALDEPKPVLLVTLAIPYLVIVTAIGYTRQGVAVGFFMLGLTCLRRYQPLRYVCCCLLAIGFHFSAIVLLPLAYFGITKKGEAFMRYAKIATMLATAVILFFYFSDKLENYTRYYLSVVHYHSDGAFQRSIQNGLAGITFFVYLKKWKRYFQDARYHFYISLAAIASVPASLVASTAVDRLGLYFLPFQILVFSRLPLFQDGKQSRGIATLLVLLLYALVLYVWMHMGNFAKVLWLPFDHLFIGTVE